MKVPRCPRKLILALLTFSVFVLLGSAASAQGQGYRTIYRFQGGSDGWEPFAVPAVDKDGNLYGATFNGGTYNWGTIFKLTAPQTRSGKWVKTVLYNVTSQNQGYPCSVTIDARGTLYGTGCSQETTGFIWQLTPPRSNDGAWTYAVLYSFGSDNGILPQGNLIFDAQREPLRRHRTRRRL